MPRRLTRREVAAVIAGATIGLPAAAWPAPQDAAPAIRLRRGMNLWPWFSLTREFPPPRTDYDWPPYEPARAVPTGGDLAALRRTGIDFVRLPVDPGPLLASSGERRAALIGAVIGAVELALAQDLSVIVNLHPNTATHHWNADNLIGDTRAPLLTYYISLVRELALRLARLDPARVALEPLNEPPQGCASADWTVIQSELLRTARAAAPHLTLLATGACGSMIGGLEVLRPFGDPNIIYTFHFYEPYVFSHQGAPWMSSEPMYRYLNGVPWPSTAGSMQQTLAAVAARMAADTRTSATEKGEITATIEGVLMQYFEARPDRGFIDRHFARVTAWADRHRIARERVLLGEFGALRTDERYIAAAAADRARYIVDVRTSCEAAGIPWAFWNLFDGMGLTLDDRTHALDPAVVSALGLVH